MPETLMFSRFFAIYEMDLGLSTQEHTHAFSQARITSFCAVLE
jgi:hypothetical protein